MKKVFFKFITVIVLFSITTNSFAGTFTFKNQAGEPIARIDDTRVNEDPNWVWVAVVVACCVKVWYKQSSGWEVGWDCGCLAVMKQEPNTVFSSSYMQQVKTSFATLTNHSLEEVYGISYSAE